MPYLRYNILSPIRLLIPVSGALFAMPFIFRQDLLLFTTLPLFYFLGLYFFLLNFPGIAESLHRRPLHLEDLEIVLLETSTPDLTFQYIYNIIMNFLLAVLFAGIVEYAVFQDIRTKSVMEALGIIGGNLGIYYKTQTVMGKFMIWLCHKYKLKRMHELEEVKT